MLLAALWLALISQSASIAFCAELDNGLPASRIADARRPASELKTSSMLGQGKQATDALRLGAGNAGLRVLARAGIQIALNDQADESDGADHDASPPPEREFRDPLQSNARLDNALKSFLRGDYTSAYNALKTLANEGDASAQYNLGFMYQNGKGVAKDIVKAMYWYRMAAEAGDIDAQMFLGGFYRFSPMPDYAQAASWYLKAAQRGDSIAQYDLGCMYYLGQGVPQDYLKAYKWLTLSAAAGDPDAPKELKLVKEKIALTQISEAKNLAGSSEQTVPPSAKTGPEQDQVNTTSPNRWLVVLGSDRLDDREKSETRLAMIKPYAPASRIVNSNTYPRLLAGWWVVVEGPFDKATAKREKARMTSVVPDAFVKAGW